MYILERQCMLTKAHYIVYVLKFLTAILSSLHMCIHQNIYRSPLCTEVPPDKKGVFAANNSTIWPFQLKEYQVRILAPSLVAPEVSMITLIPTFFRY